MYCWEKEPRLLIPISSPYTLANVPYIRFNIANTSKFISSEVHSFCPLGTVNANCKALHFSFVIIVLYIYFF